MKVGIPIWFVDSVILILLQKKRGERDLCVLLLSFCTTEMMRIKLYELRESKKKRSKS